MMGNELLPYYAPRWKDICAIDDCVEPDNWFSEAKSQKLANVGRAGLACSGLASKSSLEVCVYLLVLGSPGCSLCYHSKKRCVFSSMEFSMESGGIGIFLGEEDFSNGKRTKLHNLKIY
ncbi:hypothetical protein L195_g018184 [Trifolium pratense]|uniref:Uncharacterized protein n=1 Tax=Trifolium pratense TaxID=57577 RepID=A0A2K3MW61_TRIPR|nr:hypothetical protein L195_g018184 [Trifolium pratense]